MTSKVWKTENTYDKVMASFEKTMENLGLDYLDLYLVHWPASDAFRPRLEGDKSAGLASHDRYLSERTSESHRRVKFFGAAFRDDFGDGSASMVDQIEINPGFLQRETVDFCQKQGIIVEAWSPLGRGRIFDDPTLLSLANKYDKTVAQIALRWEHQHDIVVLPKTVTQSRMTENMQIFDFELSYDDMETLDGHASCGHRGIVRIRHRALRYKGCMEE